MNFNLTGKQIEVVSNPNTFSESLSDNISVEGYISLILTDNILSATGMVVVVADGERIIDLSRVELKFTETKLVVGREYTIDHAYIEGNTITLSFAE